MPTGRDRWRNLTRWRFWLLRKSRSPFGEQCRAVQRLRAVAINFLAGIIKRPAQSAPHVCGFCSLPPFCGEAVPLRIREEEGP